eukprot:TRINITY_DN13077_c0_g1_i1.p3 TRINITY_DN13077_c0_g1~~TRINITY_DN13077_c0_g1_i1.p3  ORF type:complete len:125 (-),score=29.19 TRINITY_DN13077_c0_g1_i1:426-800(-)
MAHAALAAAVAKHAAQCTAAAAAPTIGGWDDDGSARDAHTCTMRDACALWRPCMTKTQRIHSANRKLAIGPAMSEPQTPLLQACWGGQIGALAVMAAAAAAAWTDADAVISCALPLRGGTVAAA